MIASINTDTFPPPPDLTHFLKRADDQYLSGGCYGDVYRCWYNGTDVSKCQVAVKAFRFRLMGSDKSSKMIRRELGIWRRLKHNNIVPFLGIAHGFGMQGAVSLVSLWMPNGTLASFLEDRDDRLGVAHRLQLLLDIANGLDYLHSLNIIHGDLYCNNVLIDWDGTARLVDFGFASLVGDIPDALSYLERSTMRPGALRWASPEQVLPEEGSQLTIKSDIYSFGCVSLQVLSGKKPWSEVKEDGRIVVSISQGRTPARPAFRAIDDLHWALIERCWLSPQERPSAEDITMSIGRFLLPPNATSDATVRNNQAPAMGFDSSNAQESPAPPYPSSAPPQLDAEVYSLLTGAYLKFLASVDETGVAERPYINVPSAETNPPSLMFIGKNDGRASKRQRRDELAQAQKCLACNTTSTPVWRRGPDGPRTLCNACGLHYAKLLRNRPL